MKKFILGLMLGLVAVPAAPLLADPPHRGGHGAGRPGGWHGNNRPGVGRPGYGHGRPGHGGGYQGHYNFRPGDRRLGRNDRVWRGSNGRYYCRRSNGTTGLIVGALAGGALGNVIADGRNSTLGTLLGAGGGALLGSSIDSGNVRCR